MCSLSYHIDYTMNWSIYFYFYNKWRALFTSSRFIFASLFLSVCVKGLLFYILCFSVLYFSVGYIIIFWSCSINIFLSTTLIFCSFSILYSSSLIFVRVLWAFVKALYIFFQAWTASGLSLQLLLKV